MMTPDPALGALWLLVPHIITLVIWSDENNCEGALRTSASLAFKNLDQGVTSTAIHLEDKRFQRKLPVPVVAG